MSASWKLLVDMLSTDGKTYLELLQLFETNTEEKIMHVAQKTSLC